MPTRSSAIANDSRSFLFLLASSRIDGNTEQLARIAARALPTTVEQRWIRLLDTPLPSFSDIRHTDGVYPAPHGHEQTLAEATLAASDLVIAAPLYWYSVPASAKLYLDYWSAWMRVADLDFRQRMRGKRLWVVTVISDDDDSTADPLVGMLKLSADYLAMDWRGVLLGHGSRPGEVLDDAKAIAAAARFLAG